jgi:hypothetical protein
MTRDRKDATAQPNAMLHETRRAADGAWHDENESVPARTLRSCLQIKHTAIW